MKNLIETAQQVCEAIGQLGLRYCIIGGLANLRWGRQRFTRDVDLSVFTGFGEHEERAIEGLIQRFRQRRSDTAEFARAHRVLLLEGDNGIGIDVALGGLPFEEELVDRATLFDFGDGKPMPTCSAEDFLVLKAFADRTQDWADIEGVCLRQGSRLQWREIFQRLGPLAELKEAPTIMTRLAKIRDESTP